MSVGCDVQKHVVPPSLAVCPRLLIAIELSRCCGDPAERVPGSNLQEWAGGDDSPTVLAVAYGMQAMADGHRLHPWSERASERRSRAVGLQYRCTAESGTIAGLPNRV